MSCKPKASLPELQSPIRNRRGCQAHWSWLKDSRHFAQFIWRKGVARASSWTAGLTKLHEDTLGSPSNVWASIYCSGYALAFKSIDIVPQCCKAALQDLDYETETLLDFKCCLAYSALTYKQQRLCLFCSLALLLRTSWVSRLVTWAIGKQWAFSNPCHKLQYAWGVNKKCVLQCRCRPGHSTTTILMELTT